MEGMKMSNSARCFRTFSILVLVIALAGLAVGQHNSENDVYVQLDSELAEEFAEYVGLGKLGSRLYDTQEGIHEAVKDSSGEEVAHYYIWFCIGDECVPVDPFEVDH
jgi:hypothetical protein